MTKILAIAALAVVALVAQNTDKKGMPFHGKVEAVNESTKSLTVNHDSVPGWMDAMTMAYSVDEPEILKKVKVGDEIKATVYKDDYTLHKVTVVPKKK